MQKGCPKCGRMIDSQYEICPNCKYDFKEIDSFFKNVEEKKYSEEQKYGGFIKRLIAGLIDIDIMAIIWYIISFYLKGNILLSSVVITIIYVLSNAILERSSWRGSLGKKILELEVTDEYENPITFPKAIVRNTCKIANVLTLGIGFLTSSINVFFKDMNNIVAICLQFGIWFAPIMYDESIFESRARIVTTIIKFNPIYYIVTGYRNAMLHDGFIIDPILTIYYWTVTIIILIIGYRIFNNLRCKDTISQVLSR